MIRVSRGWNYRYLFGVIMAAILILVFSAWCRARVNAQGNGFQNYVPAPGSDASAEIPRPLEVPELYAFDRILENGIRQVVLVDSESKRICVYHIDTQGKVEFVANRNFEWDLKMEDFNGTGLTPGEIKEAVERSQPNIGNR